MLDAGQRFLALRFSGERLFVDPLPERLHELPLQLRADLGNPFRAFGRRQLAFGVAGQPHQNAGEAPVQGAGREGRDAGNLHGAVEGLVVVAEPLVVGAVPGLVCIQQGDHQPRPLIVPPHPAGGLDVLGMGLRLALNHYQPQPGNVQAHGDHVGGDGAIDPLLLVEGAFQPLPRFGHLVGGDAGGQLQHLGKGAAVPEQAPRFADALALAVLLEGVLHLLLQNAPGAAEFAQAVEVAEHGHVRVGRVVLVLVPAGFPKGPLRRAHQRQPDLAHDQFGAASRGGDAEIAASRRLLQRLGAGKERIPPVRPRRWEDLGLLPAEQGLNLILGAAHGGGGGDDLGPRRRPVKAAHAQRFDGGFV